ncbi:MAG: isopentenyl-diphosphate Delta-isomerase [Rhodospirillaceae bacterium]|nr:isopentenyl-diphosphate Delta-isomerase [Rhodospirillaceae bacterium]
MPDEAAATDTLLIMVDVQDRKTGFVDKVTAHQCGILHRAFSIFVFDAGTRLLLQRRASGKYHSGGLWSNTCCSHPRPGESLLDSAHRRLQEEMGFDCPLETVFGFVYRATLGGGLVEHEFDHVIVGRFHGTPLPDPREVEDWGWESVSAVQAQLAENPMRFTAWFKAALDGLLARGLPR